MANVAEGDTVTGAAREMMTASADAAADQLRLEAETLRLVVCPLPSIPVRGFDLAFAVRSRLRIECACLSLSHASERTTPM